MSGRSHEGVVAVADSPLPSAVYAGRRNRNACQEQQALHYDSDNRPGCKREHKPSPKTSAHQAGKSSAGMQGVKLAPESTGCIQVTVEQGQGSLACCTPPHTHHSRRLRGTVQHPQRRWGGRGRRERRGRRKARRPRTRESTRTSRPTPCTRSPPPAGSQQP